MEQVPFGTEQRLSEYLYRQLNQLEIRLNDLSNVAQVMASTFGHPDKIRYLGEGCKNYIINGNCAINQRTSGAVTIAAGTDSWVIDRFRLYNTTDKALTFNYSTMTWGGSSAYPHIRLSWDAGAPTTGDVVLSTRIEDGKTLSGQIATLQYAMACDDITAYVTPFMLQALGGGVFTSWMDLGIGYATSDVRAHSHTFEFNDVSALATTAGAGYIDINFHIHWRSTTHPFFITNFQLESGDKATPFEYEQREATFRKCCRYFQSIVATGARCNGQYYSTTAAEFYLNYLYHMRNTPIMTLSSLAANAVGNGAVTFTGGPSSVLGLDSCAFDLTGSAAMTINQAVWLNATITLDAEL